MEVRVQHLDHVQFAVHARHHSILCDQPAENGGADAAMTPPELLLGSLGSCAAFYAVQFLMARNLSTAGVEVTVTAEKLKQPARLGAFLIHVLTPLHLSEEQREGLLRSVKHCLIHNTLLGSPQIDLELAVGDSAFAKA